MNFLFRTFILLGALLVLLLFVALLAPYWIDWKQFTREFETEASRVIGQPVKVGGSSNLRLLPLPYISFEDLEVGRNRDGSPLMTVERFSLNAELFPFLSGEVRIVEMEMRQPHINLQIEENGTVAWTSPSEPVVDLAQVKIEKLTVIDGSAGLSGFSGGRTLAVENLQAEFSARSVLGPWRIDGRANIDGVPSAIDITTGSFLEDQRSMRFRTAISRDDQPYVMELDGPVSLDEGVLSWVGRFLLKPLPSNELRIRQTAVEPLPFQVEGDFSASPRRVDIPDYRLEIGSQTDPYVVTGNGRIAIEDAISFSVQADGRQIDLDRLDGAQSTQAASGRPALERRLAAVRSVIERIPVPTGKGEINVALPAVVAGDTYIRDVVARVRPFGKGWDLRMLRATFPGNTLLEAQGRIGLREDFGFAGKLLLASRQPSGFASWLTGEVSPQIRNLRAVGLDATATISPRQATFENLELRLDDALLAGKLQWLVGSGDKPAIIAELSGNRVNTEDLRALYSIARGQSGDDLVSHDLNITLNAGRLESRVLDVEIEAEDVEGQIQVRDGSVSIERFSAANLYGASVTSEGRIENVLSSPNGNMKVSLEAENGNGFLTFIEALGGAAALLDPLLGDASLTQALSLDIELDSTSRDGSLKGVLVADGAMAGTRLSHRAGFEGEGTAFDTLEFNLDLSLENDEPQVLMRQVGIETLPDLLSETVPGPLKLSTTVNGSLGEGFQSRLLASAPGTDVTASGTFVFNGFSLAEASLDVQFGSADLMPWLRVAGTHLPVEASLELPASGSFKALHSGNDVTFNAIEGQIAGNRINADLAFNRSGLARPRLEGALNVDHMDILLLADTVFGRYGSLGLANDVLAGEDLNFGAPPYKGFDAKLTLSAARADFGDILSGTDAGAEFVMIDGAADINSIRFETLGGEISGSLNLGNTDGTVIAKGNFFLDGADATGVLRRVGLPDLATGVVQATGSFEGSGKSVAGLIANLSGNGFAKLQRARVSGFAPDGLGELLNSADIEGFEVNARSVRDLTERHLLDGEFDISEVDAPYSVTRGSVRFRNVGAEIGNVRVTGDLEAGLLSGNLESDFTATFMPDRRNVISGAEPQIALTFRGPAMALERSVDTGLLEGYLSLRAFEASQRRIETLEARVIENQRLLRIISFNRLREDHLLRVEQERQALEAEAEIRRLNEAARKLEDERARSAGEAAREAELLEELRLRQAREAAAAEAARVAEEADRNQQSGSPETGIQSEPLPPLENSGDDPPVAPSLQENIIQNLENFLQAE